MRLLQPKAIIPIGILAAVVTVVALVHAMREEIAPRAPENTAPLIRTVRAEPTDFQFQVTAHGTVKPRSESDLVPQVSGEVVWVSPDLVSGGFVAAEQPLVRIDRADYEAALESARANVARAESEFARAEKERNRQQRLADRSVASEAHIDDAENSFRVAQATLRERRAQLERAERDLERTELRAPYRGRVRSEQADVGQFASRGVALARLYAVDYAEIRLPLPDREIAYLDLDETRTGRFSGNPAEGAGERDGPRVALRAEFAGKQQTWEGKIVRSEGELDPKSRMVQVVARVEDPYGRGKGSHTEKGAEKVTENGADESSPHAGGAPLEVGLFVEAEIVGRTVEDAYVLPRNALRRPRGDGRPYVLVVDDDSRLRIRDVEVLRTERGRVIVGAGLSPGERVCISPLRAVTDGMRVRVAGDASEGDAPGPGELVGAGS